MCGDAGFIYISMNLKMFQLLDWVVNYHEKKGGQKQYFVCSPKARQQYSMSLLMRGAAWPCVFES